MPPKRLGRLGRLGSTFFAAQPFAKKALKRGKNSPFAQPGRPAQQTYMLFFKEHHHPFLGQRLGRGWAEVGQVGQKTDIFAKR